MPRGLFQMGTLGWTPAAAARHPEPKRGSGFLCFDGQGREPDADHQGQRGKQ